MLEGAIFVLYRFFFRFVFGIDFWSIFGAILVSFWGAFGSPNQSFFSFISCFFFVCFLHRFLVDFGSDFGVVWGGLGEPKSVISGIDFLMIFGCPRACAFTRTPRAHTHTHTQIRVSKSAPRAAKSDQKVAKSDQKVAKTGPRAAKSSPRAPTRRQQEQELVKSDLV